MIVAGRRDHGRGRCASRALATPGHRPEHLAFAVADLSRGAEPWMLLTGDSLLVGDLARPDLAVEPREGARDAARQPARSCSTLGDHVEVWPAHVGGSLCGGAGLSGKTSSTIGFERRHNPLLVMDEPQFVEAVTDSLPSRPPNIERIVELNRRSAGATPARAGRARPRTCWNGRSLGRSTVLDCRFPTEFDAGHLRRRDQPAGELSGRRHPCRLGA